MGLPVCRNKTLYFHHYTQYPRLYWNDTLSCYCLAVILWLRILYSFFISRPRHEIVVITVRTPVFPTLACDGKLSAGNILPAVALGNYTFYGKLHWPVPEESLFSRVLRVSHHWYVHVYCKGLMRVHIVVIRLYYAIFLRAVLIFHICASVFNITSTLSQTDRSSRPFVTHASLIAVISSLIITMCRLFKQKS